MSQDRYERTPPEPAAFEPEDDEDSISLVQLRHLLYAPLRRPLAVVLPWIGVIVLSVVALYTLPKKYRSSTLILIESEKVPDSFVPRVATHDSTGRLENIETEILSRTRLERVVAETNPYPQVSSTTRAVEAMRGAIWLNQSGSDGFTLEFVHESPRVAQQVVDRLATLFIDENVKARGQQVEAAVDFLVAQVDNVRKELEAKDAALRRYKEQRMGRLPEQLQTNMATLEMLQRELQAVEEGLFLAREKQDALARAATRASGGGAVRSGSAAESGDLESLRDELSSLRVRYTDQHPDVASLRARIARMEAKLSSLPPIEAGDGVLGAESSAELNRIQLQQAQQEVAKLDARRGDLEGRIAAIRARVEDTPRTEQELANLTRDYNQLSENYTALLNKQLEAQMAGRLEQRWKGDRFRMLDPAFLPEKPDSPRPFRILGLGLILGLLAGLAVAVGIELLDSTVKDAEQLQALVHLPVLARIPHVPSLGRPASR